MPAVVRKQKRPAGSDQQLRTEIAGLERERAAFQREHAYLKENAQEGIGISVTHARQRFEERAAEFQAAFGSEPIDLNLLVQLAALWLASRPEFKADLEAALDLPPVPGRPVFSELSRQQVEAKVAAFDEGIRTRDEELAKRDLQRRREELEAELEALGEGVVKSSAA
jgi:hypothetical protein